MLADLDGTVVRTPALERINSQLVTMSRTPGARQLLSIPPQEGKTTLVTKGLIPWLLWLKRKIRIAYVSYELGLAREVAAQSRDFLVTHGEIGLMIAMDTKAKHWWKTTSGGSVYAAGIGGPLSGRPADLLIIDDPFKGPEEADSDAFRDRAHLWWQGVGSARLGAGAQVLVVQTRWHEDDLIGFLHGQTEGTKWNLLNIPAQADHHPEKGETDVLGRKPGEFMISARGRSVAEWRQRKIEAGSRMWTAMYQGRPSPEAGDILKRELWQRYLAPMWITRDDGTRWIPGFVPGEDAMLISIDCAFKDREQSDYVAIQTWLRRGPNAYLLDQMWGHFDFVETVNRAKQMAARWPQATIKLIEEAANGVAVIASLRSHVSGVIGEIPQGTKVARARNDAVFGGAQHLRAGRKQRPPGRLDVRVGRRLHRRVRRLPERSSR